MSEDYEDGRVSAPQPGRHDIYKESNDIGLIWKIEKVSDEIKGSKWFCVTLDSFKY